MDIKDVIFLQSDPKFREIPVLPPVLSHSQRLQMNVYLYRQEFHRLNNALHSVKQVQQKP